MVYCQQQLTMVEAASQLYKQKPKLEKNYTCTRSDQYYLEMPFVI